MSVFAKKAEIVGVVGGRGQTRRKEKQDLGPKKQCSLSWKSKN